MSYINIILNWIDIEYCIRKNDERNNSPESSILILYAADKKRLRKMKEITKLQRVIDKSTSIKILMYFFKKLIDHVDEK